MTTVAKSLKNAKPHHSHQTNLLLRGFVGLKRPMNGINVNLMTKAYYNTKTIGCMPS